MAASHPKKQTNFLFFSTTLLAYFVKNSYGSPPTNRSCQYFPVVHTSTIYNVIFLSQSSHDFLIRQFSDFNCDRWLITLLCLAEISVFDQLAVHLFPSLPVPLQKPDHPLCPPEGPCLRTSRPLNHCHISPQPAPNQSAAAPPHVQNRRRTCPDTPPPECGVGHSCVPKKASDQKEFSLSN